MARPHSTAENRFWKFVKKTDSCWLWTGYGGRYGWFGIGPGRHCGAHRFAWTLANGPIPTGMVVRHLCDNGLCVRPDHLAVGTQAENIHDKVKKGRQALGERVGSAKLTVRAVTMARVMFTAGVGIDKIASCFGVSRTTVERAIHGLTWGHAGTPVEGYARRGENHFSAKLSDQQVAEIRATVFPGQYGAIGTAARRYGVARGSMSRIVNGRSRL